MRWDYGKAYQEIRKSKGLTQEDVCQDFLARSTLARIESGNTIPKFDTMVFLLHQIDMSLEEFEYICNLYHPSPRQEIINAIYSQHDLVGTKEIEILQKKCQDYLKTYHDIPIEHILDILNVVISLRRNGLHNQNDDFQKNTQKIWSYLEKQNTWYENDLRLLRTIIYYFPIETIKEITPKILDSLAKYKDFQNIKSCQLSFLTCLSTIYLYNNLLEDCEKMSSMMLQLSLELKQYDSLALSQVRLGICRKDDDLIKKGLELLRLTEETALLKTMEEEIKKFR